MERVMPARPEQVWQALCDPAARSRWLGATGQLDPVDPVVGSQMELDLRTGQRATGTVVSSEPGRFVPLTWQSPDAPDSEVRFEVGPHPKGTLLVLTHLFVGGTPHRMAAG